MTCKTETIKRTNDMVEDLKSKEAMIIECPSCGNSTFIGIGQAFSTYGEAYPIGDCAQCLEGMRKLDGEKDLELMMEFRGQHWDEWVLFCLEKGFKPCVEDEKVVSKKSKIVNVNWTRAENLDPEERKALGIKKTEGLVAIESRVEK